MQQQSITHLSVTNVSNKCIMYYGFHAVGGQLAIT